jgi:hypothetical protein
MLWFAHSSPSYLEGNAEQWFQELVIPWKHLCQELRMSCLLDIVTVGHRRKNVIVWGQCHVIDFTRNLLGDSDVAQRAELSLIATKTPQAGDINANFAELKADINGLKTEKEVMMAAISEFRVIVPLLFKSGIKHSYKISCTSNCWLHFVYTVTNTGNASAEHLLSLGYLFRLRIGRI